MSRWVELTAGEVNGDLVELVALEYLDAQRRRLVIANLGPEDGDKESLKRRTGGRELFGGPRSDQIPHQEAEIESGHVDEQPLDDVLMTSQVSPSHSAAAEVVSERSFEKLTPIAK